ncbi:hypothetical protein F5Y15DRAFT_424288 [Xylariaceae sp. FL0016]|nr:hypothetical protein F5Y15DRAFT_424288 [Xylariaceae sp. FL0016]
MAGFLWGQEHEIVTGRERIVGLQSSSSASKLLQVGSRHLNSYDIALSELQQLESEPLCHRIAARLLVNNCQLLEGKDEATVLTDSGRKIRDFIDSYAASLAICDLERGSFIIPRECSQFREHALSQLPLQNKAHLHVTSTQIDNCLSSLSNSDSAWNTWVSYRHKALRFCEAARADHDRAQNILLFRRLTEIMNKLTDDIDQKFDEKIHDFDSKAQATSEKIESLFPQLDQLDRGIQNAAQMLSTDLIHALRDSAHSVNTGIENAGNLQKMLEIMLKGIVEGHAESVAAHENSLQVMSHRTESELATVMAAMAAAVATTTTLHNQLEISRRQATELESRQGNLDEGIKRLIAATESLSTKYDDHKYQLQQAQDMTSDILDKLGDTATTATTVHDSILGRSSSISWWPYVWCPAVSLVMGSYGLPPSALRNAGLIALGESAGFVISTLHNLSYNFSVLSTLQSLGSATFSEALSSKPDTTYHDNKTIFLDLSQHAT